MREELREILLSLRFNGMEQALDRTLNQAEKDDTSVVQVLIQLLNEEQRCRQERSLAYRISQAKMPWDWSIETFPFGQQPAVSSSQIRSLAELGFISRAQNIVFVGPPGTGKTGLAIGILREALINGYKGRFYKAQDLIDELYASLADRTTTKLLKRLSLYDVLVIDELGYLTLKTEQVNAFFKLLDMRYGKVPTIITTNLVYSDWYGLFENKPLVDALLDRLQHHCITITIDGSSLRTPDPIPSNSRNKRTTKKSSSKKS